MVAAEAVPGLFSGGFCGEDFELGIHSSRVEIEGENIRNKGEKSNGSEHDFTEFKSFVMNDLNRR
jgi:hypothetical protein